AVTTHTTPLISSSSGTNSINENITCYVQDLSDADGDNTTAIYNWYKDGEPIAVLNMPFDINVTNASVSNSIKDYSGYGNDGTGGAGDPSKTPTWTSSGKVGGAYDFDGLNDYIEVADSSLFDFAGKNVTVSVWFKVGLSLAGENIGMFLRHYNGSHGWHFSYTNSGIGITHAGSADNLFLWTDPTPYNDSMWHHAVVTLDGTKGRLYLDGNYIDDDWYIGLKDYDGDLFIGGVNNYHFNGSIDEVKIYNYTLSPNQIWQEYVEGNASHTDNRTIVSDETDVGDVWTCEVTPNDATDDGTALNSSDLTVLSNAVPTHTTPLISSSSGTNSINENITCYVQDLSDADGDNTTAIYNWYKDGEPITVVNMPFDTDSSTIVKDYSGYGNNGTAEGDIAWTSQGKIGGAYEFDDADDCIDLGTGLDLQNFTFSVWVKPGDMEQIRTVISKYHVFEMDVNRENNGKFHCVIGNDSDWVYPRAFGSDSNYTLNEWNHFACTFDGTNLTAYMNGVRGDSVQPDGVIAATSSQELHIGRVLESNDYTFNGTIDEFKFYNYSLSADQIWQKYIDSNASHTDNRTIVSDETDADDVWRCEVTPNDANTDGTALNSSDLTIVTESVGIETVYPTGDIQINLNEFFNVTLNVSCLVGSCGVINVSLDPSWYNSNWNLRKDITIDHTKVDGNQINFPVLIKITDTDLRDSAKEDGDDIFFADTSGTKLNHEIESFNKTTGSLTAWVKIPSLSGDTNTTIQMYYNNSEAANQENASGVWNEDYVGVWHFSEGSGTNVSDSTDNENHGDFAGSPAWVSEGVYFNDVDWVSISSPTFPAIGNGNYTVLIRVNREDDSFHGLFSFITDNDYDPSWGISSYEPNIGKMYIYDYGDAWQGHSDDIVPLGEDATIAWVRSSTGANGVTNYINGGASGTIEHDDGILAPTTVAIANDNDGGSGSLTGTIYELHFLNASRSAGWIKTAHENQNSPSTFAYVGSEERAKGGLINTTTGAVPFYTNASTNPLSTSSLIAGQSELVTFWVNATGEEGIYEFFAYANLTSDLNVSDTTSYWYVTITGTPTHTMPLLNSTYGTNTTNENITCYVQDLYDPNDDNTTAIYNWYKDGEPIAVLNMPFDTNLANASVSNSIKDYSGYGNNGTGGAGDPSKTPTWTSEGKVGGAYEFDGVDDYVNTSGINFSSSQDFTLEAWINPSSATTGAIISNENTNEDGYNLIFTEDQTIAFVVGGTVTGNLILNLDAANDNSYPESGSIWYDLTTNNYDARGDPNAEGAGYDDTYFPVYQSNDGGRFYFDGGDGLTINSDMGAHTTLTYDTFLYKSGTGSTIYICDARNGAGTWFLTNYDSHNIAWNGLQADNPTTYQTDSYWWDQWLHLVATSNSSGSQLFLNSSKIEAPYLKLSNSVDEDLGANFRIGNRFTSSGRWVGYFAVFKIYDKVLSQNEINQNFQSIAYRVGPNDATTTDTVSLSTYTHVIAKKEGATCSIYLNGGLSKSFTCSVSQDLNGNLQIGHRASGVREYFNGFIDEVKIYNYSLSADQIWQNFVDGNASHTDNRTIVSNETSSGDVWTCEVTPNDAYQDGTALNSSDLMITTPGAYKFYVKDSTGNNIAYFDDAGYVVISGTLQQSSSTAPSGNDDFIIQNSTGDWQAWVDGSTGNMYLRGTMLDWQAITPPADSFIIQNSTGNNMSYIDSSGNLRLSGGFTSGGNP
ncbi:MAG: DUF2341 domain-containing protein, partial [Candidatus Nanoarchaeia archaeon]|nr:DUF2341 domain-containing protein [Candidatus Nanoarchaeia archaeon]